MRRHSAHGSRCRYAAALLAVLVVGQAQAFMPLRVVSATGNMIFVRWPLPLMDANGDGDVNGIDEGVLIYIEGGDAGFTATEIAKVIESFDIWERVSTSYVAFTFADPFQDAVPVSIDGFNTVQMETPEDATASGLLDALLTAATVTTFAPDDESTITDGDILIPVTAGTIIESDIVLNSTLLRAAEGVSDPVFDLKAALVHEIGTMIGLNSTPMNNLIDSGSALASGFAGVETAVLAQRSPSGILTEVGVTPSMYPFAFITAPRDADEYEGTADLAPDDIAGVSFLYPRLNQGDFFSINSEARSTAQNDNVSFPIGGAHVVAWCDVDGIPSTPRVPFISTITGYYKDVTTTPGLRGRFSLLGLLKQVPVLNSTSPIAASYTITLSALDGAGLDRQAPEGLTATDFGFLDASWINTTFPSQVFHESGNLVDLSKVNLGTPLVFDLDRGTVVSADTGKTLSTILNRRSIMFGTRIEETVCPFNVISASLTSTAGPDALRAFRDKVLQPTAFGRELIDVYYYVVAPGAAKWLIQNEWGFAAAWIAMASLEWALHNSIILAVLLLLGWYGIQFRRTHRRLAVSMVGGLFVLLGLMLVLQSPAEALLRKVSLEELTRMADAVVTASVDRVDSSVESGQSLGVSSQVTITVSDDLKKTINSKSVQVIHVGGGRVGGIATRVSEMPAWKEGENALLFLRRSGDGFRLLGGVLGKHSIQTDGEGNTIVIGLGDSVKNADAAAKVDSAEQSDTDARDAQSATLEDVKSYLKEVIKQQKSEQSASDKH